MPMSKMSHLEIPTNKGKDRLQIAEACELAQLGGNGSRQPVVQEPEGGQGFQVAKLGRDRPAKVVVAQIAVAYFCQRV